jgi:FKBP-type peptidyl-prolyl cis-trans isomerase SlyD|tara:strand:- start:189 stop:659 length:471 start_codon:yes stop_codon:yes gene_type:complete
MSLTITDNLVVSITYTLTNDDATVLDSTEESGPMDYLHGGDNIIQGLEDGLEGKQVGDKLKVRVDPEDGYGEVFTELMQVVDLASFEGVESVEAGMQFESETDEGELEIVTIKSVEGNEVTIDANHPLAGVTLNFDVEIVGVRKATAEEIEHEHVH